MLIFDTTRSSFGVFAVMQYPRTDHVGDGFADDCADEEIALCSLDSVGCAFVPAEDEAERAYAVEGL
jgi:hypothetical protein